MDRLVQSRLNLLSVKQWGILTLLNVAQSSQVFVQAESPAQPAGSCSVSAGEIKPKQMLHEY